MRHELVLLLSAWVPGALGLFLRSKLYPLILGRVGRNVAFGCNIVLRHPHKIEIDDNVVIDDQCCLDAKGTTNRGISIKRGVFVGRNTILSCKNGDICLEEDANIGFNVEVFSAATVRIGRKVLIAAYTYLVGGDHLYDKVDVAVLDQGANGARHRRRRQRLARGARRHRRRRAHRAGRRHRRRGVVRRSRSRLRAGDFSDRRTWRCRRRHRRAIGATAASRTGVVPEP